MNFLWDRKYKHIWTIKIIKLISKSGKYELRFQLFSVKWIKIKESDNTWYERSYDAVRTFGYSGGYMKKYTKNNLTL